MSELPASADSDPSDRPREAPPGTDAGPDAGLTDPEDGTEREGAGERSGSPAELDPQSDRWLVDKARAGDPDAWEVLIRRHRDRIYRIALRMLGNRDDAEDVTQDVVVQLLTALAGFTGGSSFTTWLYRIVINRSVNHQRRRRVTRPILESDHPVAEGPEPTVLARGRTEATGAALAQLPETLRSALVLHEMEGLSYREVATILRVSEPTVRGRIYRARRALLDDLREWS